MLLLFSIHSVPVFLVSSLLSIFIAAPRSSDSLRYLVSHQTSTPSYPPVYLPFLVLVSYSVLPLLWSWSLILSRFSRCSLCSWCPVVPGGSKMLPASIQITGELLSAAEVQDICESLKEDSVRLLSVRGCQLSDRDFARICRSVSESRSLAQLNLNLGVVCSISRTRQLAEALKNNRSLQTLL